MAQDAAVEWAKGLDVASHPIRGTLTTIDVVDVGRHRVRSVAEYTLG